MSNVVVTADACLQPIEKKRVAAKVMQRKELDRSGKKAVGECDPLTALYFFLLFKGSKWDRVNSSLLRRIYHSWNEVFAEISTVLGA
jgi:hypothetical protein